MHHKYLKRIRARNQCLSLTRAEWNSVWHIFPLLETTQECQVRVRVLAIACRGKLNSNRAGNKSGGTVVGSICFEGEREKEAARKSTNEIKNANVCMARAFDLTWLVLLHPVFMCVGRNMLSFLNWALGHKAFHEHFIIIIIFQGRD